MNRQWPFFAAMISNLQMSLFKSDMRIALEYSKLCSDRELADLIYGMILEENERSITAVRQVAEVDALLANDPVLTLSLTRRDPYLDPLAYLQIGSRPAAVAIRPAELDQRDRRRATQHRLDIILFCPAECVNFGGRHLLLRGRDIARISIPADYCAGFSTNQLNAASKISARGRAAQELTT
jgi:hypothetical protein